MYNQDYWWSDSWDSKEYWRDFDFSKPFFEQFYELYKQVPQLALNNQESENSQYTNQAQMNKDCYIVTCSCNNESCLYWMWFQNCKDSMDCLYLEKSELCYELINGKNCYKCYYSENLDNCSNCTHCKNCISCKDCFACSNLRNKQYHIWNKKYSKEEYFEKIKTLKNQSHSSLELNKRELNKFDLKYPKKYYNGNSNEQFNWDFLENNKNSLDCFNCRDSENIKYCRDAWKARNCMDLVETLENDFCLEVEWSWWGMNMMFWAKIVKTSDTMYSSHVYHSNNCFWCVWLKKAKYCILNKQYTKKKYEILIAQIIEHMQKTWEWWEYFPVELSLFAYNETVAQEYFPLKKEVCLKKWYKWKDEDDNIPNVTKVIPAEKLPDSISDIPDDVLNWAIKCEISWRPFKFIPQELKFYREHNIPVPHLHPDERHKARMKLRNPRKLYDRQCVKCNKDIQTTYAPEWSETVYCEGCYLKEVY